MFWQMDGPPRLLGVQCTALFAKPERRSIGTSSPVAFQLQSGPFSDLVLLCIMIDKLMDEFGQLAAFMVFGLLFVLYTAASRK